LRAAWNSVAQNLPSLTFDPTSCAMTIAWRYVRDAIEGELCQTSEHRVITYGHLVEVVSGLRDRKQRMHALHVPAGFVGFVALDRDLSLRVGRPKHPTGRR